MYLSLLNIIILMIGLLLIGISFGIWIERKAQENNSDE